MITLLPASSPKVLHIGWLEVRLIIAAQITHDDALAEISKPTTLEKNARREIGFVAKKLELSEQQLQFYIPAPPIPHTDYPNGMMLHKIFMQLRRWARRHAPARRHVTAKVTNVD